MYGNVGINRMLTDYEKAVRSGLNETASIDELSSMLIEEQTIEHILPEEPDFGFPSYGFSGREEYETAIGNLTLLEKTERDLYHASRYRLPQKVAAEGAVRNPVFSKKDIEERTTEIAKFCVQSWPLWNASA